MGLSKHVPEYPSGSTATYPLPSMARTPTGTYMCGKSHGRERLYCCTDLLNKCLSGQKA
jgi:hypothetical protein